MTPFQLRVLYTNGLMIGKNCIAPAFFYRTRGKVRKTWHWDLYLVADCVCVCTHTHTHMGGSVVFLSARWLLWYFWTERCCRVVSIRASYSEGPGFKRPPGDEQSCQFSVVCLSLSRQMPEWHLRFDHDAFFHVLSLHCSLITIFDIA
jgi:hypothetical protein